MRTNHVKAALKRGETVLGAWLSLPSPFSARLIAQAGFDWLLIDTEHAPIDVNLMAQMVNAIADAGGPAPLVRVAAYSVENIKRALDSGAWGVLVPMVNSRAEAEAVVQACKYPPEGVRSLGGAFAALGFGTTNRAEYSAKANQEILVAIQIESHQAVEDCEAILSVPGLDLAFIGPNDLHASLGLTPRSESEEPLFLSALERVKQVAARYKVPLGIYASNGQAAQARLSEGFQFVNATSDLGSLQQGLELNLNAVRKV
jgi:4-hydroxy-2-oxoheptanedioate aldolase